MSSYLVTTTAATKLLVQSGLERMNDQLFLGEKLECAVSFGVNGVSKIAVNCWKHGDDRADLVIVGCLIDLLANCKLRHRELLPESSKNNYQHQLFNISLIIGRRHRLARRLTSCSLQQRNEGRFLT
jgi:hypothetical protein